MTPRSKSRNIKLTIEYTGTHFHGWQLQEKGKRTVQGEIQQALQKIFKHKIILIGSGRTDAGVHAAAQVANFKTTSSMPAAQMFRAINANLPEDVAVLEAAEVAHSFHAQFKARRKLYRYTILNRPGRCVHQREYVWHIPYALNLKHMRQAAKYLVGRHDFRSFVAGDSAAERLRKKDPDTTRTVRQLKISEQRRFLLIDIEANGFLYKMVRNIVGTLVDIGAGRLPVADMKAILKAKDRNLAGDTAPARGLCLLQVTY